MSLINLFLAPGLIALIISTLTTIGVIKLYTRLGWVDDPLTNKHVKVTHKYPTPRGGGIPIYLALLVAGCLFLGLDKHFLGILTGATILAIVGVLDDIHDLSPYVRLITGALASLAVVAAGIGIAYITNPFVPGTVLHLNQPQLIFNFLGGTHTIWVIADIFALIWILWTQNIVNWSKGVDGQMPGFIAIAAIFIGILSLRFVGDTSEWQVARLAAITAGAYLGFLPFNFYPQRIMPGYGGGSLGGFLLAVLAILSGAKVAALILILGIPMLDAAYTVLRRLLRGKSPVWGDRGHLHHRLLDLGWTKPQIALLYWSITAIFGILALYFNSRQKLYTIIATALIFGGVLLWLKFLQINFNHKRS